MGYFLFLAGYDFVTTNHIQILLLIDNYVEKAPFYGMMSTAKELTHYGKNKITRRDIGSNL